MTQEIRPVPGYEGTYSVSNFGDVYSHRFGKTRTLAQHHCSNGYLMVDLCSDGDWRKKLVHRIVASAFCPQRAEANNQVNHLNGIKTFNHASNLEWTTPSGNMRHAHATGLLRAARGTSVWLAKLTEDSVHQIRHRLSIGIPQLSIAREFGVGQMTISDIHTGKTWTHVSD